MFPTVVQWRCGAEIVNPHCLVDDEVEIIRLARNFAKAANGFEPGPYVAVEVWRKHGIV